MIIKHKYGKWIALIIGVLVLIFAIRACEDSQSKKKITKIDNKRVTTLNADSLAKAVEARIRAQADDSIRILKDSLEHQKALTKQAESSDTAIVVKYIKVPTFENGKAVIASKDKVIASVRKESKTKDGIISKQQNKISSYQRDSVQTKVTLAELNKGYQDASKLAGKKSKPKRIGIGLQAGYGTTVTNIKPQPYVGIGLSYNLIRL